MATLTDARFDALRTQLFTGSTSDMILQWLQANGATSDCTPDAWAELEVILLMSWHEWLVTNGYDANGAHHSDMELLFWLQGGILGPYVP